MSQVVYDGPGRGRKQCNCGLYLHVKSGYCEACGHEFRAGAKEKAGQVKEKPQFYNEGGKGKKECPKCNKFVGARIFECTNCGFDFTKQTKEDKVKKVEDSEVRNYATKLGYPNHTVLLSPNRETMDWLGKPKTTDESGIHKWMSDHLIDDTHRIMFPSVFSYVLRSNLGLKECVPFTKTFINSGYLST